MLNSKKYYNVYHFFRENREITISRHIISAVLDINEKKLDLIIIYLIEYEKVLEIKKVPNSAKEYFRWIKAEDKKAVPMIKAYNHDIPYGVEL